VRHVLPEILDSLDPADPRAVRSRRDLRRVHRAMRTVSILRGAIDRLQLPSRPRSILELGGGDGTLLLRLARSLPRWSPMSLTLLDAQDLVSERTRAAYRSLGWQVRVARQDAMDWAADPRAARHDLCVASLFLHHFPAARLRELLAAIARNCRAVVACEPRRNAVALLGSRMIGVLGANRVTRSDAVTSVIAGFNGGELAALWPAAGWRCQEYAALPFIHCFIGHCFIGAADEAQPRLHAS
jgi:SAM-dependent methyltransferase